MVKRCSLLLLLILVAPTGFASDDAVFRAGYAEIDITPTKPMPMWGYGDRHADLSTGVLDPLHARAVVVDVGTDKLAIVGLDLGRSPDKESMTRIREAILADSGVNYVLMSGSHTHHGPVLELTDEEGKGKGVYDAAVEYVGILEDKLIEVINEAAGSVRDARIGWAMTEVDMNRNRHTKIEPKPTEPELNVIRFDDRSGKPIALVANFAAHPTNIPSSDLRYSADYPGWMARTVLERFGAPCVFMQGAAGDMSCKKTEATNSIEKFGAALGEEVIEVAKSIETTVPEAPQIQAKDEEFAFETRLDFGNKMIQQVFKNAFFPEIANAAIDEYEGNVIRPHLTTVLLNQNLAMVGGSGEFFCNHSNRLKERSRVKTLFFGYCNGHHMYFPTIEAAAEGGYGADASVSWVPIGAGEEMMNRALENIYRMLGSYKAPF